MAMPSSPSPPPDDLSKLLQAWKIEPVDDPRLAQKVWQRLAAERPSPWRAWIDALSRLLAQPIPATAAILLFAAVGALAAELARSSEHEVRIARLAAEYAHAIDPVLMTDSHGSAHSESK